MRLVILSSSALFIATFGSTVAAQDEDLCGASGFQGLVGQDHAVAELLVLDRPIRIYGAGDAVTMDMRPERINFIIDENGKIAEIVCG
jgi:hypothetical protein